MMENEADMSDKKINWITVTGRGTVFRIECRKNESILEAMTRQNVYVGAACGGRGVCGKCRLLLLQGDLAVTSYDRSIFSEEELKQGFRLACKAYPVSDCIIKLLTEDEKSFEVIADSGNASKQKQTKEDNYAIAIDIGTTTLAVSLFELQYGNILKTYTAVNRQRVYGFDILSRIQASINGKSEELKECIMESLMEGIKSVIVNSGVSKERIRKIAIAGNTTMGHLLMGYSCKTLGSFPFIPVNIDETILPFKKIFGSDYLDVPVILLPGISTYVGGDITSGLFFCDYDKTETPSLFIDLGTNGEMAVGKKDRILVSSSAAGPAFEGGNISCGVGSITGAICNVSIQEEQLQYRTIGNGKPVGICGTGIIELISELLKANLIDETGLLDSRYFETGYPVASDTQGNKLILTQKDIREFQLAKAAVRAGIEILMRRFGINYEDIDTVYLAGGFGYQLDIGKAAAIGLLPKKLIGKVKAIGNSSLKGAIKYLTQDLASCRMEHIIHASEEINLAEDSEFKDLYIKYMYLK